MAKKVYLVRHAEKDDLGTLTELGRKQARELRILMPHFSQVYCSESSRAQETATLISDIMPKVDSRAGYYMASQEQSDLLNRLAKNDQISFLEAAVKLNDPQVLSGIEGKAKELNSLILDCLSTLRDGESALIVSHDLSISPAMQLRDIPLQSLPYLSGYIIDENKNIEPYNRN